MSIVIDKILTPTQTSLINKLNEVIDVLNSGDIGSGSGVGGSIDLATPMAHGLMSANDKNKINGIDINANRYVHPANHQAAIIITDSNNRFVTTSQINTWDNKATSTVASQDNNGLMSKEDKLFLDSNRTISFSYIIKTTDWVIKTGYNELVIFNSLVKEKSIIEITLAGEASPVQIAQFQELNLLDGGQSDGVFKLKTIGVINTLDIPIIVNIRGEYYDFVISDITRDEYDYLLEQVGNAGGASGDSFIKQKSNTLYITSTSTLTVNKPASTTTVPFIISANNFPTLKKFNFITTAVGFASAVDTFVFSANFNGLSLDAIYTIGITWKYNNSAIISLGSYTFKPYKSEMCVAIQLNSNLLTENIEYIIGQVFNLEIAITKLQGTNSTVNLISSVALPASFIQNDIVITSDVIVDSINSSRTTQGERNRNYENRLNTLENSPAIPPVVGDNSMKLYPTNNNEINIGGADSSNNIIFGNKPMDSKSIPKSFVFGKDRSADIYANTLNSVSGFKIKDSKLTDSDRVAIYFNESTMCLEFKISR